MWYTLCMEKKRYAVLDGIRGLALVNMVVYHTIWDLVYIFGCDWGWYESFGAYIWQQCICWTFIGLSGFCLGFGGRGLRRGLTVFAAGALVSAVTLIFMPADRILFGVLTLIGSAMIIVWLLRDVLGRVNAWCGAAASFILFLFTKDAASGWLGFFGAELAALPDFLYANLFTAYLGFPASGFYSADYFPLIPWIFLFTCGFFLNRALRTTGVMDRCVTGHCRPLEWLGRHSLIIYMLHQPVIYAVLCIIM